MASEIKADYEKILDLENKIKSMKDNLKNRVEVAKEKVDKLDNNEFWCGDGYETFRTKMANFKSHFDVFMGEFVNITNKLDDVVESYKKTDKDAIEKVNSGG